MRERERERGGETDRQRDIERDKERKTHTQRNLLIVIYIIHKDRPTD